MTRFQPATAKLSIGSIDDSTLFVHAQYNPKEVQLKRTVPWTEHKDVVVEFTGVKARSLSVELLFDGFEAKRSVQPELDKLEQLASPHDPRSKAPHSKDDKLMRPHWCIVAWGFMPKLRCVIESVTVKYTMFDDRGTPLRAIATVELKEAASADQQPKKADQHPKKKSA
jgi:hypothetical protein